MIIKSFFSALNVFFLAIGLSLLYSSLQTAVINGISSDLIFPLLVCVLFTSNIYGIWKHLPFWAHLIQVAATLFLIPITYLSFAIAEPFVTVIMTILAESIPDVTIDEEKLAFYKLILPIIPHFAAALFILISSNIAIQAYLNKKSNFDTV